MLIENNFTLTTSSMLYLYGNINSTALNPACEASWYLSNKLSVFSVNMKDKLAQNLRTIFLTFNQKWVGARSNEFDQDNWRVVTTMFRRFRCFYRQSLSFRYSSQAHMRANRYRYKLFQKNPSVEYSKYYQVLLLNDFKMLAIKAFPQINFKNLIDDEGYSIFLFYIPGLINFKKGKHFTPFHGQMAPKYKSVFHIRFSYQMEQKFKLQVLHKNLNTIKSKL